MVNGPSSLMIDLRDTVMLDGYAKNYQRVDFSVGPSARGQIGVLMLTYALLRKTCLEEGWAHSRHSPAGKSIV